MSIETENKEHKIYLEERKDLIKAEQSMYEHFDHAILTLSASALGISVTFINQIAPNPKLNTRGWILAAWLLFSFSVLSTLISFLLSQLAFRKQIDICEKVLLKNQPEEQNKFSLVTQWCNYLAIVLFTLGVISLVIFCFLNLSFK